MNTKEIAARLTELCKNGDFETAQRELFSSDAVSIEPHATPAFEKETKGLDNILEKGRKFNDMVEKMNGVTVSEPVCADNSFALAMTLDAVMKGQGAINMTELCVYTIKDGKITAEQFFM